MQYPLPSPSTAPLDYEHLISDIVPVPQGKTRSYWMELNSKSTTSQVTKAYARQSGSMRTIFCGCQEGEIKLGSEGWIQQDKGSFSLPTQ